MTMRQMLDKIFRCYGSEITLERGAETVSLRGFFQPDLSRAKQNLHPEMTQMGLALPGQYLLQNGAPLYQWALCTKKGGADAWAVPS